MPTIAELMQSLPEAGAEADRLPEPLAAASMRPVPVGRLRRIGLLGTLQAKIAAAYLFHWLRGCLCSEDERQRLLRETHWRTAVRVLDSMGYLRGAVTKMGQTLANLPDIAPKEFVQTLERLHYDAPPMHWSLLREMVHNELGDDPENLFASFETRAFAAASLGQVHGAQLPSGEKVAVKIQYPGIARAVTEDFQNLNLFMFPARLDKDWGYVKGQVDDLRLRLEMEVDYQKEAAMLARARSLFREEDGIVVPRVHPQLSTERVLTMERLEGVHLDEFLRAGPSQEQRNEAARKIFRAWYRLFAAGRVFYADLHPGNFLFLPDGRLGMIDFGFVVALEDELWRLCQRLDRGLTTGSREDRAAGVREWSVITDDEADADRLRLSVDFSDWAWGFRYCGGEFDFGDEAGFRRGIDLAAEMVRKRYTRANPCTPSICRQNFGIRSLLYRLKARIDVRPIVEEEMKAAGWDRHDA
ncbi:MAG: AarF/ABC1/UbiB kinase family protein [Verrucomicrobia bacterium]|nr:AarF/ABC1/UbiB kinase family protein [Verrucomicrobiota bacterium]